MFPISSTVSIITNSNSIQAKSKYKLDGYKFRGACHIYHKFWKYLTANFPSKVYPLSIPIGINSHCTSRVFLSAMIRFKLSKLICQLSCFLAMPKAQPWYSTALDQSDCILIKRYRMDNTTRLFYRESFNFVLAFAAFGYFSNYLFTVIATFQQVFLPSSF